MDISNRSVNSQAVTPGVQSGVAGHPGAGKNKRSSDQGRWGRIGVVAAIAAVVILLIGVTVLAASGGNVKPEGKYVDDTKLQAVFLNTGQVYFGNVKSLNNRYLVLTNIYYLQTQNSGSNAQQNSNTNVQLVKLGCELHEPFDQMVINRDQITFWENLQDNGQVAKAVKTFKEQNPQGQKCSDQSSSADTNSGNNAQNAGNANTNTSGSSNTNNSNR